MPWLPPRHGQRAQSRKPYDREYAARRDPDPRSTARWRRARNDKLIRNPLCEQCLERGTRRPAQHVHHRQALKDGGALCDTANLESLCVPCHAKESARERRTA